MSNLTRDVSPQAVACSSYVWSPPGTSHLMQKLSETWACANNPCILK